MPNYQQSEVAGTQWKRACRVVIDNPLDGNPIVMFLEEEVVQLGDHRIARPVSNIAAQFAEDGSFPLINPETGALLGQGMTHQQLYVALYSLYMQQAALRDAVAP